ncbi:hypothetical protein C2845_PM05G17740 [Panicum miliaceum]|uniref:FBD domain-containing protein n=1 Tax=Panicum miliaceum TaxID=4540 RepID=A0A3L6T088_PANMI|nr:hypothetical protein C2845_PM05G17740 [Panicum miliaceum]
MPRHAGYFAGFADGLFAPRGDAGVGSLQILLFNHRCTPPEKAGEWTRYAVRHAADSFLLRVTRNGTATTVELPSHGRTASIRLHLSGNQLRLPAPTASMLDIRSPVGLLELVLAGVDALEELHLSRAEDLRTLDVTAPNLRVLRMDRCFRGELVLDEPTYKVACKVVALRLQLIGMRDSPLQKHHLDMGIHDLTSVRRPSDLYLDMHHGRCYHGTNAGVWLLEKCPRVEHVEVSLDQCNCDELVLLPEFAPEGAAPFASVTSLKVDTTTSFPDDQLVAGISSLLLRCPRLTSLSIELLNIRRWCIRGDIENHPKISLGSLEEVEISGFRGAREELDLVSMLFESSSTIKRMTLLTSSAKNIGSQSRNVTALPSLKMMDEVDPLVDYEKLKSIPRNSAHGRWDIKEGVYTWTYYARTEVQADGSIAN